MKKEKEIY